MLAMSRIEKVILNEVKDPYSASNMHCRPQALQPAIDFTFDQPLQFVL
jgi:hypothetical protein